MRDKWYHENWAEFLFIIVAFSIMLGSCHAVSIWRFRECTKALHSNPSECARFL